MVYIVSTLVQFYAVNLLAVYCRLTNLGGIMRLLSLATETTVKYLPAPGVMLLLLAVPGTLPVPLEAEEPGHPVRVVFLIGEDEYESSVTLPDFAAAELEESLFEVTYIHEAPEDPHRFPGLVEALEDADLLLMSVRRRTPPADQLEAVRQYLGGGGGLVALRTSSHAFGMRRGEPPEGHATWDNFDEEVLGGRYEMHYGNRDGTRTRVVSSAAGHPILSGIEEREFVSPSWLYRSRDLAPGTRVLMEGMVVQNGETFTEPVAWTFIDRGGRIFYTSMGHDGDFQQAGFRRMLHNAIHWAAGIPVPPAPADRVFLGGEVLTVDAGDRVAQGLAIRGQFVVAVGSDEEIARFVGPDTVVTRLRGKTVIPGLIETHCHAIRVAREELTQPYVSLDSVGDVQAWIRRRAQEVPEGEWLVVPRTDITRIRERRHPSVAELDAASATHPVIFTAARKHTFNTLGWERLGLMGGGDLPRGIELLRDGEGNPRLMAGGADLLRREMPAPSYSDEETIDSLRKVFRRYNEVGITAIFERATNREGWRLYETLRDRGDLTVRANLTFREQMRTAGQVHRFVNELDLAPRAGDDWVRAGPLKITVDGGIHWGNTYLSEPCGERRARFYALEDPGYRGAINYTVEEMTAVFGEAHRLGWQISAHVTGDAGLERVLDALEASSATAPVPGRRFNLIHAYFPSPELARRAGDLGAGVDTQTYLYYKDSDAIAEVYGQPWAERFIGLREWADGGVPVAINADHMIGLDPDRAMNAFNPFLALYIAVTRKNDHGRVYGEHQKLSRMEALRAVTASAAWLSFDEAHMGSLEPGKLADLVVLDRRYLECPEEEIRRIRPLLTMVGGEVVFE